MNRPITAFAACLVSVLVGCSGEPANVSTDLGFEDMPADHVIHNLQHYMTSGGLRRGVLRGDTAYFYAESSTYRVLNPDVDIYDDQGQISAQLTSREGDLDVNTEVMVVRGDVVLEIREGNRRITTEELHFDCNSMNNRIWSNTATTIVGEDGTMVGSGFTADCQLRDIQIRDARGTGFRIE